METIRQRAVLTDVLLQTLASSMEGLRIQDAYEAIDNTFEFPERWYRQLPDSTGYAELERMGIEDWRSIPQEDLVELVRTEPQWQNEIRWARNELRKLGFLDVAAPRGTWRLTSAGKAAATTHTASTLTSAERTIATPRTRKEPQERRGHRKLAPTNSPPSRRQDLLSKLDLLVHGLPISDLDLVVSMARLVKRRTIVDSGEAIESKS